MHSRMVVAPAGKLMRNVCTAWQTAEEICPPNNIVTNRLHESTETCCTYCEDEESLADDWRAEQNHSTVISDCSTMESDEDVTDISVLALEAAAACGPENGSMVAVEQPEIVMDCKEENTELHPPRPSASNLSCFSRGNSPDLTQATQPISDFINTLEPQCREELLAPSSDMGPSQDLDDNAHEALRAAARDDGGGGDLKMKSSFGKRLSARFEGPPATSMTREESVKELIARVSARKVSTDLCSSTAGTGRQTKLALRQAADSQTLDLKSSFMKRLLPRLRGARQS